jgi:hypothetical protein
VKQYFGTAEIPPLYPESSFIRRYRVPRQVFDRIFEKLNVLPDFLRKPDALGNMGIHPLQRISGALRVLGFGYAYAAVDELIGIAESTMALTLRSLCRAIVDEFGPEYLREPNEDDMRRILAVNESRGFPGCLGSIDCQHWEWKNCPVAWAGQFKGKERKPTVAMEAIADGEVWFWHLSVGHAGSMNDLNIMNSSSTMQRILSGEFPPKVKYTINGKTRDLPYWLADGIYPAFAIFVKTIKGAVGAKLKHFSSCQEAVRKDIERAFGILMQRFHFLSSSCRMWNKEDAMEVLRACVILHNMCVEHRRDHYEFPPTGSLRSPYVCEGSLRHLKPVHLRDPCHVPVGEFSVDPRRRSCWHLGSNGRKEA